MSIIPWKNCKGLSHSYLSQKEKNTRIYTLVMTNMTMDFLPPLFFKAVILQEIKALNCSYYTTTPTCCTVVIVVDGKKQN